MSTRAEWHPIWPTVLTMPFDDWADGRTFFCGRGLRRREKAPRCIVCGKAARLLCDGPAGPGFAAPLCAKCTTRPAANVVALPDPRGPWPSPMAIAQIKRRQAIHAVNRVGKLAEQRVTQAAPPARIIETESVDWCPWCANRTIASI